MGSWQEGKLILCWCGLSTPVVLKGHGELARRQADTVLVWTKHTCGAERTWGDGEKAS